MRRTPAAQPDGQRTIVRRSPVSSLTLGVGTYRTNYNGPAS